MPEEAQAVNEMARVMGERAMAEAEKQGRSAVRGMADAFGRGDEQTVEYAVSVIDDAALGLRQAAFGIGANQTAQVLEIDPPLVPASVLDGGKWDGNSITGRLNRLIRQNYLAGLPEEDVVQNAVEDTATYLSGLLDGDYQAALREGVYEGTANAPIVGYVKVPGPLACSWCRLVSDRIYWTRVPFHQACRCGVSIVQPDDLSSKDQIRSALRRAGAGNSTVDRYTASYDRLIAQKDFRGAAAQVDRALARAGKQAELNAARLARADTGVPLPYDGMTLDLIDGAGREAATDNKIMRQAYRVAGYDELPTLVDDADFAQYRDNPDYFHGFRGTGNAAADGSQPTQYSRELMEGDYFPGRGVYGNGTYTAVGGKTPESLADAVETAQLYARGGSVIEFAMARTARIIDIDDLQRNYDGEYREWRKKVMERVERRFTGADPSIFGDATDISMFAIEKGFDAIKVGSGNIDSTYLIVLNRSKMIINREIEVLGYGSS